MSLLLMKLLLKPTIPRDRPFTFSSHVTPKMRLLAACAAVAVAAAIVPTALDRRSRHMRVMHRRGTRHALRAGVHLPADQFYNQTLDHFDTLK